MKILKNDKVIGGLLIIALLISVIISSHQYLLEKFDLNKNGKYTIGITTKTTTMLKGNDHLYYTFYYNGKKYNGKIIWTNPQIKVPNGKYYIKFSTKNPFNNFLVEGHPVPDSINLAPIEGWDNIPQ